MIAFIFPGQGSQKVGMGKALADAFPICRDTFAEADAALGEPLSSVIFEGPEDQLTLTENTQPAILTVSTAAHRLLASRRIKPAFVAGHSLGEYSANVAAGTFTFADALRIVRRRGRYMQEAVPVATVDGEPKCDARSAIEALVHQVSSPVRWEEVVARLASEGVTTYVEVGPGAVLSGLVRKIHREATVVTFGSPDDLASVESLAH